MPDSTLLTPLKGNDYSILLLLMRKLPLKADKYLIHGILVNKWPSWDGNQAARLQPHSSLCVVLLHLHNPTSLMLLYKRECKQQKGL